jgi:hypothetical protein
MLDGLGNGLRRPSGDDALESKVIFLVHHHADNASLVKQQGAAKFSPGELGRDQATPHKIITLGVCERAVDLHIVTGGEHF